MITIQTMLAYSSQDLRCCRDLRRVCGARAAGDLAAQPHQRVILAADDSLLERDQGVVGDLDVLRADLGAAQRGGRLALTA
jgi:hypothetical protein